MLLYSKSYNAPFILTEVELPAVGTGQVLVRIKASGVNPLDTKIRAGEGAHAKVALPAILGMDLAGKLKPLLSQQRFTFETALDAHAAVAAGKTVGKIVVEMDD